MLAYARCFGSIATLPLEGREVEQDLASAKSIAKQGGSVTPSAHANGRETTP